MFQGSKLYLWLDVKLFKRHYDFDKNNILYGLKCESSVDEIEKQQKVLIEYSIETLKQRKT